MLPIKVKKTGASVVRITKFDNGRYCDDPGRFPRDGTCPYLDPYNGRHCIKASFAHFDENRVKAAHALSVSSQSYIHQSIKPANNNWRLCGKCS